MLGLSLGLAARGYGPAAQVLVVRGPGLLPCGLINITATAMNGLKRSRPSAHSSLSASCLALSSFFATFACRSERKASSYSHSTVGAFFCTMAQFSDARGSCHSNYSRFFKYFIYTMKLYFTPRKKLTSRLLLLSSSYV